MGPGQPGYDAAWSLVWGRQMVAGSSPSLSAPLAPTPHPLSNMVAVVLGVLPVDTAVAALSALTWLAFGALVVAVFELGRHLGGVPVGVVAAIVVGTRPLLALEASISSLDVPFTALVVWAVVVAVRARPDSLGPLVLLAAAGLLRPEAWLLSAAWAVAVVRAGRPLSAVLPWAAAGPVVWAGCDLMLAGHPLFSFVGTRDLADQLDRPQSLERATLAVGAAAHDLLNPAVLGLAVGGLVIASLRPARDARIVLGALAVSTLGFLLYGLLGLPVLLRYTVVPMTLLAVLAAWSLAGWVTPAGRTRLALPRWAVAFWAVAAVAGGAVAIGHVSRDVQTTRDRVAELDQRRAATSSLRELVRSAPFRADRRGCPSTFVPGYRGVPLVALWTDDVEASAVRTFPITERDRGVALVATTPLISQLTALEPDLTQRSDPPAGWVFRGGNAGWSWYRRC